MISISTRTYRVLIISIREFAMDISDRKRMILTAVVTLHTDSGDPVGSNILNHFLDHLSVSSATLRNEMAELTSLGLLEQPYTSAGRVPTQMGMRYYIDNLMHIFPMTRQEKDYIDGIVAKMDTDSEKAAESSVKFLSEMFDLASIAMTPKGGNPHLVHFKILRVGRFNLAVIGVSNSGSVKTRVCRIGEDISDEQVETVEQILNDHLVFVSSEDVRSYLFDQMNARLKDSKNVAAPILHAAMMLVEQLSDVRLYSDGEQFLLHYKEMDAQIRSYLEFLNDPKRVIDILSDSMHPLSIYIGEELDNSLPLMGLIVCRYNAGGTVGYIGLAGPARMNYPYLIPRLKYYCDSLSAALTE